MKLPNIKLKNNSTYRAKVITSFSEDYFTENITFETDRENVIQNISHSINFPVTRIDTFDVVELYNETDRSELFNENTSTAENNSHVTYEILSKELFDYIYSYDVTKLLELQNIKNILNRASDVNKLVSIKDTDGWNIFGIVIMKRYFNLLDLFISKKIDLNIPDYKGWTAIHQAAFFNYDDIVRILFNNGALLNIQSFNDKVTPLYLAVNNNCNDSLIALLELGADVNLSDKNLMTPLHLAIAQNKYKFAELLLKNGADVNAIEINQASCLHGAVFFRRFELVQLLLNHGAKTNIKDVNGYTPVYLAKKKNDFQILELLNKYSDNDVNQINSDIESNDSFDNEDEESKQINKWLAIFEQFANDSRPIISDSMDKHFTDIVQIMKIVGAQRSGSKNIIGSDGKKYIVDIYILPSGSEVLAGYVNSF